MTTLKQKKSTKQLTTTDTDDLCLEYYQNPIAKFFYQLSLWNGLYMLNGHEKKCFQIATIFVTIAMTLYFTVFFQGFLDGIQHNNKEETMLDEA